MFCALLLYFVICHWVLFFLVAFRDLLSWFYDFDVVFSRLLRAWSFVVFCNLLAVFCNLLYFVICHWVFSGFAVVLLVL